MTPVRQALPDLRDPGAPAGREPTRRTLERLAAPVLDRIRSHPFWQGLRAGTLPAPVLWHFAEQDARFVVPAYARALSRCAALAGSDAHATLLSSAATATFGSLPRLREELAMLAAAVGGAPAAPATAPTPVVHAYASFLLAAPATSFAGAVGALLPMSWFHLAVSRELRRHPEGGPRYARWIAQFGAHDGFDDYLSAFLTVVGEVATECSAAEREQLLELFSTGASYELAFADSAWQLERWPD
ncbi:TenA family protein [Micromonospora sp. DT47]|uniref:TenA family protein n=1 Tax=Micromonospora sp. DT47 TaxID=3393431 RepID=UPI003CEA06C0